MTSEAFDLLVVSLGWTLLHFVWQGVIIGLLHEAAIRLAVSRTPQLRYTISLLALVALLAVPVGTFFSLWHAAPSVTASSASVTLNPAPVAAQPVATGSLVGLLSMRLDILLPWLVAAWMAGVAIMCARFGIGLHAVARLTRQADFDAVAEWMHAELRRLADRMGLDRSVRLAISTRVGSPLVVGWLRPVILLPLAAATGLDHRQLRMVLAHELAHLHRYDHLVNLFQVVVEMLLFYHPAVHRVSRSLRREREQCCDDLACEIAGDRFAYARVLAELEHMRQGAASRALALGMAEQELYARIERLVRTAPDGTSPVRQAPLVVVALAALMAGTAGIDPNAPLLPDVFDPSRDRYRVALELPPATARPFVPISAPPAVTTGEREKIDVMPHSSASAERRTPAQPGSGAVEARQEKVAAESVRETRAASPAVRPTATPSERTESGSSAGRPGAGQPEPEPVVRSGGEIVHMQEPEYPRRAMRYGREGWVELEFVIGVDGNVRDVEVLDADPRGYFEDAAAEAISQWRYRPFVENGSVVEKRARQVLEFRLSPGIHRAGKSDPRACSVATGTRLCRTRDHVETELSVMND